MRAKVTGGEPLLRSDIVEICSALSKYLETSVTTNGYYLSEYAPKLAEAGLHHINVSLPALDRERYRAVTGVDGLDRVVRGIEVARDVGLKPMTINVVLLRGYNDRDIERFIDFASRNEARLRFIEFEPIGVSAETFARLYLPADTVIERIRGRVVAERTRSLHNRPVYILDTGIEIEIVKWFGNPRFCYGCDRVRITPRGEIRVCIALPDSVDASKCFERLDEECLEKAIVRANELRRPFYTYPRE